METYSSSLVQLCKTDRHRVQFGRYFIPPNGWTNDPEEFFEKIAQATYQDPESEGYELLQNLGLKTATVKPVMAHTRRNGGTLHIFESGGNFYLWNIVEGTVGRFQDKDFDEILQSMMENDGGTKKLEFEERLMM